MLAHFLLDQEVTIMEFIKAIILGIIQGLTEFLPVSSSGHLVIFQKFMNVKTDMFFDVMLHVGTLISVFIVYWDDILKMFIEFFSMITDAVRGKFTLKNPYRRFVLMVIIGCIPTGLMGIFLNDFFESLFNGFTFIGYTLLITGVILWLGQRLGNGRKNMSKISVIDALVVGIFQGIAITPGISRSGSTIVGGLLRGFDRELATKFSFIISIPTILGAALLEGKDVIKAGTFMVNPMLTLSGMIAAAISGIFAIKIMIKTLNNGKLHYFSYYCWSLGLFILIYSALGM